jgi:anaerobic dimethyl sulfoxide reductase subunit B (iron-sulfur subunit)
MPTVKQYAFYVDSAACTGCKACEIACKDKYDLAVGVSWRRVAEYAGGAWAELSDGTVQPNMFAYYMSIACNHCEKPICLENCPAEAISKRDDGIVLIDDSKCVGCRYCEWVCPYSAPQFNSATGKMTKCTFCHDFLSQGLPTACVAACPSRALDFGDLDVLRQKYGAIANIEPLPDPSITKPSLVVNPNPQAQLTGAGIGAIANPEELR